MFPRKYFGIVQKRRASILLYVLFLTSFLILFFAGFQKEIEKTLEKTVTTENSVRDQSTLKDIFARLKNNPVSTPEGLPSDVSLGAFDFNDTSFSGSLGLNEVREYWVTAAG